MSRKPLLHRRSLLTGTSAALTAGAVQVALGSPARAATAPAVGGTPAGPPSGDHLLLLGTAGGPNLAPDRVGTSTALRVGDQLYVVDCGHGSYARWGGAGYSKDQLGRQLRSIYLTHLHSDHIADYFSNLWVSWALGTVNVFGPGRAGEPIPVFPPDREPPPLTRPELPTPGTRDMTTSLISAYAYDINSRLRASAFPDFEGNLRVHDIGRPGPDYAPDIVIPAEADATDPAPAMEPFEIHPPDANGVRVSAILVPHGPVFPSLAYRFDGPGWSVTISGDTAMSENVIRLARGSDILVHEVIDAASVRQIFGDTPLGQHVLSAHTDAVEVGQVAQEAGVGHVVLNHLFPIAPKELPEGYWRRQVRKHYRGPVTVGGDLMTIPLTRREGDG
ncbi:MBL fold metallo-hydrolase [Streptomyces flavidovirens]|uniref:MBL fold metallo-hydrolase n=1 Tax=Streptomyces flavidovirens TaxID=67298 RepID=UPI003423459D